jgi:hypothetical protein
MLHHAKRRIRKVVRRARKLLARLRDAESHAVLSEYDSQYDNRVKRVTATLDKETLAQIRRVAGPRGVSNFLNQAARERLARMEFRGLLDALDAKHGPVPSEVHAEVARTAKRILRPR